MKKNILILVLLLTTISFVVYSYNKAMDAEKAANEVKISQAEAEVLRKKALQLREAAEQAAAEAQTHMQLTAKALADCENR